MADTRVANPTVGFCGGAKTRAQAAVSVLMHGHKTEHSKTFASDPEHTFYELESLFGQAVSKLQSYADAAGHLDVHPGGILSIAMIGKVFQLEIGCYTPDSRTLTVRVTRCASMTSVWGVLEVPQNGGGGWWATDFRLEQPPSWPNPEAPSQA